MSTTESAKTSLKWFFNQPSSFFSHPEESSLLLLRTDYSKLASAYLDLAPKVPASMSDSWREVGLEAHSFEEQFKQDFSVTKAFDLLVILSKMGAKLNQIKQSQELNDNYQRLWQLFRTALADLIVYAKKSRDFSFKTGVLNLVKEFET